MKKAQVIPIYKHDQQIHQFIIKINRLMNENKLLHEQLEHVNGINKRLIHELTEKEIIIAHLKKQTYTENDVVNKQVQTSNTPIPTSPISTSVSDSDLISSRTLDILDKILS